MRPHLFLASYLKFKAKNNAPSNLISNILFPENIDLFPLNTIIKSIVRIGFIKDFLVNRSEYNCFSTAGALFRELNR